MLAARTKSNASDRSRGYTLIELLVALVIVAVLAAIAVPSYLTHLRKGARAEAQSFLVDAAARQHQFLIDRRAYAPTFAVLGVAPPSGLATKFVFAVDAPDTMPPTFTLTARAIGGQADDRCPTLAIDSRGNQTPASCWN